MTRVRAENTLRRRVAAAALVTALVVLLEASAGAAGVRPMCFGSPRRSSAATDPTRSTATSRRGFTCPSLRGRDEQRAGQVIARSGRASWPHNGASRDSRRFSSTAPRLPLRPPYGPQTGRAIERQMRFREYCRYAEKPAARSRYRSNASQPLSGSLPARRAASWTRLVPRQ